MNTCRECGAPLELLQHKETGEQIIICSECGLLHGVKSNKEKEREHKNVKGT